jgi:hypothetical protein
MASRNSSRSGHSGAQCLRKAKDPRNPANRRISLIVQSINRPQPADELPGTEGHGEKPATNKIRREPYAPGAESHAAERPSAEKFY